MYTYLIQASICLIILYGIYHFVLSELTFFRHNRVYLIGAIILSLLVPAIAPYIVMSQEQIPVVHWSYIAAEMESVYVQYDEGFDYTMWMWALLGVIYFTGVSVVLARMIFGLSKIYKYFLSGEKEVKNGFNIITTDSVHLPFSFFKSVYISRHIPLSDHVQTILDHEEIHIKHWHTVDVLFAEAIQAFFWFNPVMIFYKRALRQAHEYLADDIICSKNSVSSYTELLLSKSQTGMGLALTNQFFHSQIKKRIEMMTKNKTDRHAAWKYALVLPALMGLLFVFSCKESPKQTSSDTNKDTPKEGYYYTDKEMEGVERVVEIMPEFPGCEHITDIKQRAECAQTKMLEYIYQNLKYPTLARQQGISGQCVAQFIVSTDGTIENIKIVKDIGEGCGEAVNDVLTSMNNMPQKWNPGKQNNKLVKVLYTLPVKFSLDDNTAPEKKIGKLSRPKKTEPDHKGLLNILLTRQSTERPLLIVDGEEKETNYLSKKGFMSGDVTIILPSEAEKIYGEAAKHGCVKIANPKFDINKVVDAFYKHIKDEEYSKKLIRSFSDTENTDSLRMYKNKISQIMEKTRPIMIAALKEQESRSLDVNLTRLAKGEEVKLPTTFKIKNNDSEEDVQIKKGDLFVSGNGIRLDEDIDYVVDYGKSTIKITNPFVINGKQSLNVSFKK
ncbi:MAG: energy transducer TonB [Saprospiraceae bacterium]|nr:energy transducer TonB [Saprospiraceae bacterium]